MTEPSISSKPVPTVLFQQGAFNLAGGETSAWKIECDALGKDDWDTLALIASERLPVFSKVVGVPTGGLPFADALRPYAQDVNHGKLLIVDDVWTTGRSMRACLNELLLDQENHQFKAPGRGVVGVVAFARTPPDPWTLPVFSMGKPITRVRPKVVGGRR